MDTLHTKKISVRNLVEFILRNGDIVSSGGGLADPDAMLEGTRIHKKIQRSAGSSYQAEVPLSVTLPIVHEDVALEITVEGRADGIFPAKEGIMAIDEIKGIYYHPSRLQEPVKLHQAQAMCYGYIYAREHKCQEIGIRITYCHIPTEEIRYFEEQMTFDQLESWFLALIQEFAKWMAWEIKWQEARNASIQNLSFPFEYREGQYTLVKGVYQSILRQKRLYIEAPTGVGKTMSTVFPTVKAMGEGIVEKIFYLTAKTITRTVAEEAFHILSQHQVKIKNITLTAKEKICILDKPQCNPGACTRALGHFDRINDAVYDVLTHEDNISRECILQYAAKHNVCPFEMSLDISSWCDAIIGDYNYAFDPTACLKRFFAQETKNDYVYLVDEAHNLVDRAREMYSATLVKEDFLSMKKLLPGGTAKLQRSLSACNKALLALKRECEEQRIYEPVEIEPLILKAMRLCTLLEEYLHNRPEHVHGDSTASGENLLPLSADGQEQLLDFYFNLRFFLTIYETLSDKYIVYADYDGSGFFHLHLQCMDPSDNLDIYLKKGRCAVFFSATLLPVNYYREQLAGREEDYAIYAPSPFAAANRLLMIGRDVSTKYTQRGPVQYQRISDYILRFVSARLGNYLVFFPSYRMLEDVAEYIKSSFSGQAEADILIQENSMNEEERELFLSHFQDMPTKTTVGLCVMGGIFGEGIDLKDSRLIGAVIVGTGLPMISAKNELFREYFDQKKDAGFDYAYRYPGMNKVLQAAGRVIRTDTDRGAILLLDERFLQGSYQGLFPREWFPYEIVNAASMEKHLEHFWK